jgi:hypothetical protein
VRVLADRTLEPNPSYWASWPWRSLMGRRALAVAPPRSPSLRLYAHCARAPLGGPGTVTALLVNVDAEASVEVELGAPATVFRLEADGLVARTVRLNGQALRAATDGTPPALRELGRPITKLSVAPLSIAFVLLPEAGAPACR